MSIKSYGIGSSGSPLTTILISNGVSMSDNAVTPNKNSASWFGMIPVYDAMDNKMKPNSPI